MRHALPALVASLAALAGCESGRPATVDPGSIRPVARFEPSALPIPEGAALAAGEGLLRVATETREARPGYGSGEGDSLVFDLPLDYDVYDAAGAFRGHVVNHAKVTSPDPVAVPLPAGRYLVAIPDARWPKRWIEVSIEAGKLTVAETR